MDNKRIDYKKYIYALYYGDGVSFEINEFDENEEIFKSISFVYSYDIRFKLFGLSNEIENSVIIDNENPFYEVFSELLNNKNELLIDDDFCNSDLVRYFKIQKEQDKISLIFHDEKSINDMERYTVTIKGACCDMESKNQLRIFFDNIIGTFNKEKNKQKVKTL